jgi:hypothetical protein
MNKSTTTTSLGDFFKDTFSERFLEDADIEYTLAQIAGRAYRIKEKSGLSYRAIASKMGNTSPAIVQRIVNKAEPHNVTLSTLVRFGYACGYKMDLDFKPLKSKEQWTAVWRNVVVPDASLPKVEIVFQNARATRKPRQECARFAEIAHIPGGTADIPADVLDGFSFGLTI